MAEPAPPHDSPHVPLPDPLDIDRLIRITDVACEIGDVAARMWLRDVASGRDVRLPESGAESLRTLAAMVGGSGDISGDGSGDASTGAPAGARGALEGLAATAAGRELDRRAWLDASGGAIALAGRPSVDPAALDGETLVWIRASAADDAAFLARVAAPAWPFDAVHGDDPDAVALAAVSAAADLLCRTGGALDGPDAPRPGTPLERAAHRFALDVVASARGDADIEAAPGWVQGVAARAEARLESLTRAERAYADVRLGLGDGVPRTLDETRERLGLEPEAAERLEHVATDKLARLCDELSPAGRTAVALLAWFAVTDGRMRVRGDALTEPATIARLPRGLRPLAALLNDPHRPRRAGTLVDRTVRTGTLVRWDEGARDGTGRSGVPLPNRLDALAPTADGGGRGGAGAPGGADRRVHLGYAVPFGSAPRHRRTVEAVRLLRASGTPFVDVSALYERHEAVFGPPGCTARTYARTLADFPHLVVRGVGRRWAALDDEPSDAPSPVRPADPSMPERRADAAPDPVGADGAEDPVARTVAARVRECLDGAPVLRASELALTMGDASRAAVASVVDDDPALRRYAPGLIARYERLDELAAEPPEALLVEEQWRLLSDALRSGERPDDPEPLFPAWRGESLEALVRWGRERGLRFVDARERLRDEDLAASRAGFEPRHLIAMAIACAERPSVGWMRVNRLLGTRVDSREAIWPIALLASLGVVRLDGHWQHPLPTDPERARALRSALFALARTRSRLRWRDEALRELLGRFDARADVGVCAESGWVRGRRVAGFLDGCVAGEERRAA